MSDANEPLPNPFLTAKKMVGIRVAVLPRDVQMCVPGWSVKRASDFLDTHSDVIASAMLATAGATILGLLQGKDHDELH